MRCLACSLLVVAIVTSCSKNNTPRTNFAEVTVGGNTFVFDKLEAVFDTSTQGRTCNVRVDNSTTNSSMTWETLSASRWINASYDYPGELFPGRSLVFLHLQTYIDRVPGTYTAQSLTLKIDQSDNGRMHGTLSGKMICYTCTPYGEEVKIKGEFEMPYSYR